MSFKKNKYINKTKIRHNLKARSFFENNVATYEN